MALYCTAADLTNYADRRLLAEMVSDTGQPFLGDLATSPVIIELIASASARLEGACFVSENYSTEELTTMSDNSKALARSIVAQLVVASILNRRVNPSLLDNIRAMREESEGYIQQLRNGERLFDVGQHAAAGLPSVKWPTAQQIYNQNQITTRVKNYYPNPAARLPISHGGG